jgi:hypothetical protein
MSNTTETATAGGMSGQQKTVALVFGTVLTLVGIIGFSGILVTDSKVLGIFGVSPLHNAVHLLTGVVGLAAGFAAGGGYSEDYNKYLGLVYLLVFVVGVVAVVASIDLVVDLLGLNVADNVLHLLIGVVLAAVGYGGAGE